MMAVYRGASADGSLARAPRTGSDRGAGTPVNGGFLDNVTIRAAPRGE